MRLLPPSNSWAAGLAQEWLEELYRWFEEYGTAGHVDFADQTVDASTGSQLVRARFPNPDRQLLPGQFVRGRIVAGTLRNGISVPERAVQIASEEATVLLVAASTVFFMNSPLAMTAGVLIASGFTAGVALCLVAATLFRRSERASRS